MAGLKAIKEKIRSVEKTRKVTKAMEAVSAAKMRKAQGKAISGRPYAKAAVEILARVTGSRLFGTHPLTMRRDIRKALYIIITSDKGLAGALNSAVLKGSSADMKALGLSKETISIIAVGRKAKDFFSKRGYEVVAYHENKDDAISHDLIRSLVDEAANRFSMGAADTVRVSYQSFISTFEQKPYVRSMLPLTLGELTKVVHEIVPKKGQFSEIHNGIKAPADYVVEPSADEVAGELMPLLVSVFVYHALLESKASEHSARMVAMKSASDKAKELTKELTLDFNKARQAAITREVSEITGGIEAMSV